MYNGYETEELVKSHVEALLRELAQAEAVGNEEEAKACRQQLKAFGHRASPPAERAEKRPAATAQVEKRRPGRPRKKP